MDDDNGQNQVPENEDNESGVTGERTNSSNLTTDDAFAFLNQIHQTFPNQSETYNKFLQIMKDFKAERLNTVGVIESVKELFKGHKHLLIGFNLFLPNGYEIIVDDDEAPLDKENGFEKAKTFAKKLMIRFRGNEDVYMSFLNILRMHRDNHKDIGEVHNEVATLLKDHQDLLGEFTRFLARDDNNGVVEEISKNMNERCHDDHHPMFHVRSKSI